MMFLTKSNTKISHYICLFLPLLVPVWPPPPNRPEQPPPPLCSCPPIYIIVTVQIYLSRSAKRTGTSGGPVALAVTARSAASPQQTLESSKASTARKGGATRKPPSFSLDLRKSGSLSSYSSLDTPSYCSPIKSPSQYFQICY